MNTETGQIHYGEANIEYEKQRTDARFVDIPEGDLEHLVQATMEEKLRWAARATRAEDKANRPSLDQVIATGNATPHEQLLFDKRRAKLARRALRAQRNS